MPVWLDSSRSPLRRCARTREQRDFYRCLASRQGGPAGRTQSIAYGWGDSAPVNQPTDLSEIPGTSCNGGGGIRTLVGGISPETVFETAQNRRKSPLVRQEVRQSRETRAVERVVDGLP